MVRGLLTPTSMSSILWRCRVNRRHRSENEAVLLLKHTAATQRKWFSYSLTAKFRSTETCAQNGAKSPDSQPHFDGDLLMVVAVAKIGWRMRRDDEPSNDDDIHCLEVKQRRQRRVEGLAGFLRQPCTSYPNPFM